MSVSRARRVAVAFVVSLNLILGVVPATSAATLAPVPSAMAAVGDSITQAASTGAGLGVDAPQNSWSTGTSSSVFSHLLRLRQINPSVAAFNESVSGAKVANLNDQMLDVVGLNPDPGYLTVLIGGNDLCTSTVGGMTLTGAFYAAFSQAMSTVMSGSPATYVYVVSIPNVRQLWERFKNNFWARIIWSSAGICQSLLANPGSTQTADVQRRQQVYDRNVAYNAILADVCDDYPTRCRFDDNAVFKTALQSSDVSGDYFHPSVSGQARLAATSWAAGYTFGEPPAPPENQPPTASFTFSCNDLTCDFDASSSDDDGTIDNYSWDFGDGETGNGVATSHNFGGDGTYVVELAVTDNQGAVGTDSNDVSVSQPPPPDPTGTLHVADLDGATTVAKGQAWTATVTTVVADQDGAAVDGAVVSGSWNTGGSSTCTTSAEGACTVSVSINAKKATSTVFGVTGVIHAGLTYVAGSNGDPDGDSDGTSITLRR